MGLIYWGSIVSLMFTMTEIHRDYFSFETRTLTTAIELHIMVFKFIPCMKYFNNVHYVQLYKCYDIQSLPS